MKVVSSTSKLTKFIVHFELLVRMPTFGMEPRGLQLSSPNIYYWPTIGSNTSNICTELALPTAQWTLQLSTMCLHFILAMCLKICVNAQKV